MLIMTGFCVRVWEPPYSWQGGLARSSIGAGVVILLLVCIPTDHVAVPSAMVLVFVTTLLRACVCLYTGLYEVPCDSCAIWWTWTYVGEALLFLAPCFFICGSLTQSTAMKLRELWLAIKYLSAVSCGAALARATAGAVDGAHFIIPRESVQAAGALLVWSFVSNPSFRIRAQSFLASRGGRAVAAAAIAELVGDMPEDEVLKLARGNFRCVCADRVLETDMSDNL